MIARILLLARTIRHLRGRQLLYRPIRMLQAKLPIPPLRPASLSAERAQTMRTAILEWGAGDIDARIARANEVCSGRFTFLNVSLEFSSVPWRSTPVNHLWSFNLHYFDYALDLAWAGHVTRDGGYANRLEDLVNDWERVAGSGGGDAWNPYTVSVRSINWMYALVILGESLDDDFRRRLTDSLHRQIVFLSHHLEWHILGNHLLKNLQAVSLAGVLFDGEDAGSWRGRFTERLWSELEEQILPDGGHFERSPMYLAIVLGDLLELVILRMKSGLQVPARELDRARTMITALERMCHRDGTLRLFNDSAHGIAPGLSRLRRLADFAIPRASQSSGQRWLLPNTGYFGARQGSFELMLDCGPVGASYQPGHAHCDILSYELDFEDHPIVVDSGVSGYEGDRFREYSRSTRAHNTLMIGGSEQSEMWGTYRVARRAEVTDARDRSADPETEFVFEGSYSPYEWPSASHRRRFRLTPSGLEVVDVVLGASDATVIGFVHFHPDCSVQQLDRGFRISTHRHTLSLVPVGFDSAKLIRGASAPAQGWFLPEFGKAIPSFVLELSLSRNDGRALGYTLSSL